MTEYPGRARAAITVILIMSALAIYTLAVYCPLVGPDTGESGGIVMDETRFAALRTVLPSRGTVGYLSDTGGRQKAPRDYYLTQYFLAPVVVAPDIAHDLVVANFASPTAIAAIAASRGFRIEKTFSNGVALLRRESGR